MNIDTNIYYIRKNLEPWGEITAVAQHKNCSNNGYAAIKFKSLDCNL